MSSGRRLAFITGINRYGKNILALGLIVAAVIAGLSVATLYARIQEALATTAKEEATASEALAKMEAERAKKAEQSAHQARQRALLARLVAEAGRPDDAFLVTGGADAGRVWDTKTWTLKSTLAMNALKQVAWTPSPRSDRIVTIDEHGVLRLFEPSTGALVAAPGFDGRPVTNATWNRDGSRLLVLLSDATARILTVYPEELQRKLCERAIRNFIRDEWKRYLGDGPEEPYRATCENLPIEPEPAGDAGAP